MLTPSHSPSTWILGQESIVKLYNVSELSESKGADYCTTMIGLYVFTGEDVTSAFKGKDKVGPLKKLQNPPRYHAAFR